VRKFLNAVLVALLFFCHAASGETPEAVSLCELLAHPARHDGRLVTFRAQAVGDWFEVAALGDSSCKGKVIQLTAGKEQANEVALRNLSASVWHARDISTEQSLKAVFVTLVGRFTFRPSELSSYRLAPLDAREMVTRPADSLIADIPPRKSSSKRAAGYAIPRMPRAVQQHE
jgi:hypothetical protein